MSNLLRIGTRGSKLALWQANFVKESLQHIFPKLVIYLKVIRTSGDNFQDRSLSAIGGKGLFVKEIEEAILNDKVDIAVHSMKDVPVTLPAGLEISTFLKREDPRDVLLSKGNVEFENLAASSVLGTGSLRRQVQISKLRGDLELKPIRGNVDTRIRKLISGEYDAIVLASAGIKRLELEGEITQFFSTTDIVPSPGQGIIGIECREDDIETKEMISKINDLDSTYSIGAERNFVKQMGGDCSLPLGCYCEIKNGQDIEISGFVASVDGKDFIEDNISGNIDDNIKLSSQLAQRIIGSGGKGVIESFDSK
jgi:hydroxymethylbilane synthase